MNPEEFKRYWEQMNRLTRNQLAILRDYLNAEVTRREIAEAERKPISYYYDKQGNPDAVKLNALADSFADRLLSEPEDHTHQVNRGAY